VMKARLMPADSMAPREAFEPAIAVGHFDGRQA
jgi:hypothetical protein